MLGRSMQPDQNGYLPLDIDHRRSASEVVRWLKTNGARCAEPFVFQTVQRIYDEELRRVELKTSLDVLLACDRASSHMPFGYIFHISRCGSTLLANMLRAIDYVVFSEPPLPSSFLVDVLVRPNAFDAATVERIVRSSILALGQGAGVKDEGFFIKFFSGNILQLAAVRAATPGVPEIFMYRDPVEVVVSNLQHPTQGWLWVEAITGVTKTAAVECSVAELCARAVGTMLSAMVEQLSPRTLLINYSECGPSTPRRLLCWLGWPQDDEVIRRMMVPLAVYAKDVSGRQAFVADGPRKQNLATPAVRELVAKHAREPYEELERRRCQTA